jgi:uncharacterized RDD family membrane protein YckC
MLPASKSFSSKAASRADAVNEVIVMGIVRSMLVNAAAAGLAQRRQVGRCECGARIVPSARFCHQCGVASHIIRPAAIATESRALVRRVLAEVVDRLLPLPFIAYLFPPWMAVVVIFHLICDGSPSGRSPGKWIFRLRVVSISSNAPCGVWRSILRRLPTALGQAAYCSWVLVPVVLAYELVSLAFVWLNPSGRRFEDYLAGTHVITEGQYKRVS